MDNAFARDLWRVLEPLHAITYFAADCRAANKAVGLRGYWMGYFAARSAPFGAVGPSVVEATFYGFHPAMVRRAIPDAWTYATPEAVIATRTIAAAAVLRTIVPDIATVAARTVPHLQRAIEAAPAAGRALFAANRDLPTPGDAVHALWQAVTALREHRGDGHVACLLSEGIDGCEAHVLFSADNGFPVQIMRDNRGWTENDWQAAHERLTARGLLGADGITAAGRALREHIEARTDALAMTAYRDVPGMVETLAVLTPAARAVARSGEVPYPNPMGADPA
ncbi:SCO6745 family protein [Nocardia tengchongensis]|uniref:SCO6745 family protein n=1 Tax=Nocardia tengchongensis TaxID=2055889 RepID=UPI0036966301